MKTPMMIDNSFFMLEDCLHKIKKKMGKLPSAENSGHERHEDSKERHNDDRKPMFLFEPFLVSSSLRGHSFLPKAAKFWHFSPLMLVLPAQSLVPI